MASGTPARGLVDVVFNVFGVRAAVDKDFLDAVGSQELEGVFDHRDVDKGKEALGVSGSAIEGRERVSFKASGGIPLVSRG